MIGLSGEIPLVSHSDVTSPFPPSGNGGYASNLDVPSQTQFRKYRRNIMFNALHVVDNNKLNIFSSVIFISIWYKIILFKSM